MEASRTKPVHKKVKLHYHNFIFSKKKKQTNNNNNNNFSYFHFSVCLGFFRHTQGQSAIFSYVKAMFRYTDGH